MVGKQRMLRGFSFDDYDKPSANRGHDPGNHLGRSRRGKRKNRH